MIVAVIDGMGAGIGVRLVSHLRQALNKAGNGDRSSVEILALGANAVATEKMLQAGADRGASGPNAISTCVELVDIILAPIGVIIPNSMLGEITPAIARVVIGARAEKMILPIKQSRFRILGMENRTLSDLIEQAVEAVLEAAGRAAAETSPQA